MTSYPCWLKCHTKPKTPSKPCLKWISDGALPCPRCNSDWFTENLGYFGVCRETDTADKLVVIREAVRDLSEGLKFGDYICISKEKGGFDLPHIYRHSKQKKLVTSLPRRKTPADLEYSLLQIFKIPELTSFMASRGSVVPPEKINAEQVPTESTGAVKLITNRLADVFKERAKIDRETADRAAKNEEWARKAEQAQRNGKHDPE